MDHIIINDKRYSLKTLGLLTSQKEVNIEDIEDIPESVLIIAEVVDEPEKLPFLLETINSMDIDDMEKFRFVLLRVQIDSELHMNEDMERYHKRLYVSQVVEKLVYGELLLEADKGNDDNHEEED